jgi:hypothetical protein
MGRKQPPLIFGVRALAEVLGAHPQTVRRWVRAGVLSGRKAGPRNHKLWFTEADLASFVNTRPGIRWTPRAVMRG